MYPNLHSWKYAHSYSSLENFSIDQQDAKKMLCYTSMIVLAVSDDVSKASSPFSNVELAISSNGWYCGFPFSFIWSKPGPNCLVHARILFFIRLLLLVMNPQFVLRNLLLHIKTSIRLLILNIRNNSLFSFKITNQFMYHIIWMANNYRTSNSIQDHLIILNSWN